MPYRDYFDRIMAKLDANEKKDFQAYFIKQNREKGILKTVFNAVRDGIMVIDRKFRIVYVNHAAQELLGLPENIENQSVARFLRDIEWNDILKRNENEWYKTSRREIEIFYPVHRFLLFYILPHEVDKGTAIIILHDVTESRHSVDKRLQSEKMEMISLLAAGVAHEIGNPLNSLSLNLQLLGRMLRKKRKTKDSDRASALLDTAESEVKRLDLIIREFLQAVRPAPLKFQRVNLEGLVSEVLSFIKEELSDRQILVKCIWPHDTPSINADAGQLKQAFYNIIRNAMQAMPGGGTLKISCLVGEDSMRLSFEDEGAGISPQDISRIFDPYYSTKKGGGGLGLVIVERIIREHGAKLSVETLDQGGAVFAISFPLSKNRIRLLPAPENIPKKS